MEEWRDDIKHRGLARVYSRDPASTDEPPCAMCDTLPAEDLPCPTCLIYQARIATALRRAEEAEAKLARILEAMETLPR